MTDFIQFATAHGLIIDRLEYGRWVRTKTDDKPHKRNGAYFHDGDYAHVQNWGNMDKAVTWFEDKPTNPADMAVMARRMAASRAQHARERAGNAKAAANRAGWILSQCELTEHAYMDGKGFPKEKGNVWQRDTGPLLCIPMRIGRELAGLQLIDVDGGKKFLSGARTNGAEYCIDAGGIDIWCEGYATALSVRAAMKSAGIRYRVHACFSAGNLQRMAKSGFVIADNDASGTGEAAAKATGLPYYLPTTAGHDFNDHHKTVGTLRAGFELKNFLTSAKM